MRSRGPNLACRVLRLGCRFNGSGVKAEGLRRKGDYQECIAKDEAQRGQRERCQETKRDDGDDEEEEDEGEHKKRKPEGARDVGDEVQEWVSDIGRKLVTPEGAKSFSVGQSFFIWFGS